VVNEGWLLSEERYKTLLSQVRDQVARFGGEIIEPISAAQGEATAIGADGAEQLTFAALGETPEGVEGPIWTALPSSALEVLTGFMSDGSPLATHLATLAPDAVGAMRQALFDGMTQGEGAAAMGRRLRTVSGITRSRAETIARTETLRAAREASRQSYEANSDVVQGYTRLSARDSRVCPACWALDGTEYETSEIMPTHANCRCTMIPKTVSWAELTGDDSIPDTRPDLGNASDVFGALDEDEQREILGPSRFDLWQGGTPLSAFAVVEDDPKWGPTARVATLAELGAGSGEGENGQ
jgi:SPP1 gp7 family putative phage head morphogenesis protein